MKGFGRSLEEGNAPVRLHLELKNEHLSDHAKRMLQRYGEAPDGVISRDILIPAEMPLHNLHYAIQRLFGWQNSHLRRFLLPDEIYQDLTGGTVRGWSELVGVLFQPPSEAERDMFWDDDYESGSIKVWLRKKYTGPYEYKGWMENPEVARGDVKDLMNHFQSLEVRDSFRDYMVRKEEDENAKIRILKVAPLIDLTLDEMNSSMILDGDTVRLLERLEVDRILAAQDQVMGGEDLFPAAKELHYNYDFGDDWNIVITKFKDSNDLIEANRISSHELEAAIDTVMRLHRPVCIDRTGVNVLDDVGGLSGFADFLETIYEEEDKSEAVNMRTWGRSMGWSAAKVSFGKML